MKRIVLFISLFISIILASAQTFEWAKNMDGISGTVYAYAVEVDNSGNVYITGNFDGWVDFDPGPGTFYLSTSGSGQGMFICKLDPSGNFVWAKGMTGTSASVVAGSIKINGSGNIFTTGSFFGTVDFDPGAGTSLLTAAGAADVFIS